jgi:hypothetical protein
LNIFIILVNLICIYWCYTVASAYGASQQTVTIYSALIIGSVIIIAEQFLETALGDKLEEILREMNRMKLEAHERYLLK